MKHDTPFTGVVFVKNKYDTCRVEVKDSDSVVLVLGFPPDFGSKLVKLTSDDETSSSKVTTDKKSVSNGVDDDTTNEFKVHKRQTTFGDDQLATPRSSVRDCGLVDLVRL